MKFSIGYLLVGALLAPVLLFTAACGRSSSETADIVFLGGKIVTADGRERTVEALAARDGKILAVGSDRQIRRHVGPETEVVELDGAMVLPGLYESHVHALRASLNYLRDPYEELGSIAEIQDWVRRRAQEVPPGEWIRVPRNDITRLSELRFPTVEELDAATTQHPVVFEAVRKYVFNSRGFSELGISDAAQSLPGAEIIPGSDGKPQFLVTRSPQYTSRWAAPDTATDDEKRDALLQLHAAYNAVGITTIFERGSGVGEYHAYEALKEAGLLTVRTRFTLRFPYRSGEELAGYMREAEVHPGMGDDWLSARTIKIAADGGIHWGNTRLSEPYGERRIRFYVHSDPEYRGDLNYTEEEMTSIFGAAAREGWQMLVHVTGDAGTDAVLKAMENVHASTPITDQRFTLTHAYFPTPDLAQRAAALGVAVDTQAYLYYKDSEFIREIYGLDWAERFMGLGTWRAAGVRMAINADHMIGYDPNHSMNSYNPFLAMYIAVSRRNDAGQVYGEHQKLSRMDALRAMTSEAAYLNFEEASSGSLEPGKFADLVVIDRDYLACPEEEIRDIKVLRTVVAGRTVYEAAAMAVGSSR